MIDADEHKKLLAQVAELEKNSVNYFDVENDKIIFDTRTPTWHNEPYIYSIAVKAGE